jgi:lipopolysaccharide export LptBFGC system permease protein LptF
MMKRFDRYLLAEALPPLIFSLVLYAVLAVVSVTLPRLQWVIGTPLPELGIWLLLQLPSALVQTLPLGLLLAVLLVFGRLASDYELIAAQAGGIPLLRIASVFVVVSFVFAGLAIALNEWVLPVTNARVGSLYWQLTSGGSGVWRLAAQDIPVGGYTLRFERVNRQTDELLDVRIEAWQGRRLTVVFAERAHFTEEGIELINYQLNQLDFASLRAATTSLEERFRAFLRTDNAAANPEQRFLLTTDESLDDLITRFSGGGFEDSRSMRQVRADALDPQLTIQERRNALVLFHRKLAEPFANITLLLVAIPLSLLYARSRSVAFGLSLVVTMVWYLLLTLGQLFAQSGSVPVWLGMWGGNVVLAAMGLYLLLIKTRLR